MAQIDQFKDKYRGEAKRTYATLLDKAVAAIVAQFGRKNAANLFNGRSGKHHGCWAGGARAATL